MFAPKPYWKTIQVPQLSRAEQKTCLITGATAGIGYATALGLINSGYTLILHGRNEQKLAERRDALLQINNAAQIETVQADFSSLSDVRSMADAIAKRFNRLDVLFNNAGLLTDNRQTGADGFELTFTVNHLAPMLLTWSLLPFVKTAAGQILFNSSSALGDALLDLDDLQSTRWHSGWAAYANTKLANMLMSKLLAEEKADCNIRCNSFCPGLVDTGLLKNNREFSPVMMEHINKRARPPDQGAVTPLFLITDPTADNLTGAFFMKSHGDGRLPVQLNWDPATARALKTHTQQLLAPWTGR